MGSDLTMAVPPRPKRQAICPNCGKEFTSYQNTHGEWSIYCCRDCVIEFKRKHSMVEVNKKFKSYHRKLTEDEKIMEEKLGRRIMNDEFVIRLGPNKFDVYITDSTNHARFIRNEASGYKYKFTPIYDNIHVEVSINETHIKKCEYCGKRFIPINLFELKRKRFCSHECAMKAQMKTDTPQRYLHSSKVLIDPSTNTSYIINYKVHRAIAESMIQRPLKETEIVHHLNFDKRDNRPENLMVLDNHKSHYIMHHYPIGSYIIRALGDGTYTCDLNCVQVVSVNKDKEDYYRKRITKDSIL